MRLGTTGVEAEEHNNQKVQETMANLYKRLHKGTYRRSDGTMAPIAGDTTKLKHAVGLTRPETQIIQNIQYMTARIPGTQEIRIHIGQVTFAAEVFYGGSLFGTISPSERHGNLMIRLSRYRCGDPAHKYAPASLAAASSKEYPPFGRRG